MSALVFDCDGVLADTERYGHLPAFNQTFDEFGLPVHWSEEEYGRQLKIGGGKERMASILTPEFVRAAGLPEDPEAQAAEIAKWHKRKTAIYTEMVAAGQAAAAARDPPRHRRGAGRRLDARASPRRRPSRPSGPSCEYAVGPERADRFDVFLAGDVVPKKKPAPDIYLLALERLGVARRGARGRGLAQRPARRRSPPACAAS